MPENVLDVAIGCPTVTAGVGVSMSEFIERSAGPHSIASNAFQCVFLVFGAFLKGSVVDMLVDFV